MVKENTQNWEDTIVAEAIYFVTMRGEQDHDSIEPLVQAVRKYIANLQSDIHDWESQAT